MANKLRNLWHVRKRMNWSFPVENPVPCAELVSHHHILFWPEYENSWCFKYTSNIIYERSLLIEIEKKILKKVEAKIFSIYYRMVLSFFDGSKSFHECIFRCLTIMHRITDVHCIYFGMIGSKWQKRSLSPQYIHYRSWFILSICCYEYCTAH